MYYVMWIVSFLWMFLDIQTCTPELEPRRQQHSTGNPGPLPLCRSGMFSQGRDPWSDSGSSGWSSWLDRKRNREKQKLLLKSNIKKPTLSQMVPLFFSFFLLMFLIFFTHTDTSLLKTNITHNSPDSHFCLISLSICWFVHYIHVQNILKSEEYQQVTTSKMKWN